MPKPLSMDLRERLISAVDGGMSQRSAAKLFSVAPSTAIKWVDQQRLSARPEDVEDAKAWGAKFVSAREVHNQGIQAVLQHIPTSAEIIICFDCDALDPLIMPGVIGRAPGGLWYWQIADLFEAVASRTRVTGVNVVEFMPEWDLDGIGALHAGRIVMTAMSLMARQAQRPAKST